MNPDDPDKVETGCDYHPKGHHFNMKKTSRHKTYSNNYEPPLMMKYE